jgi:hypothetical protein
MVIKKDSALYVGFQNALVKLKAPYTVEDLGNRVSIKINFKGDWDSQFKLIKFLEKHNVAFESVY